MSASQFLPEYVIDTSVALKWFLEREEADLKQARDLRTACIEGKCTLRAPELLLIELANALVTAHRRSIDKVVEAVESVKQIDLQLDAVRHGTLINAVRLASSYGVTIYDSYFLAVAVEYSSVLVTADEQFSRKLGSHPNILPLRRFRLSG